MNDVPPGPLAAALSRRCGSDAPAQQMADTVVGVLREVEKALEPVIGLRGVAAIVERSLHRAGLQHPWLAAMREPRDAAPDLQQLSRTLATQPGDEIGAAGASILLAVHDLLVSLVGHVLTQRLLGGVWSGLLGELPAQDKTP